MYFHLDHFSHLHPLVVFTIILTLTLPPFSIPITFPLLLTLTFHIQLHRPFLTSLFTLPSSLFPFTLPFPYLPLLVPHQNHPIPPESFRAFQKVPPTIETHEAGACPPTHSSWATHPFPLAWGSRPGCALALPSLRLRKLRKGMHAWKIICGMCTVCCAVYVRRAWRGEAGGREVKCPCPW